MERSAPESIKQLIRKIHTLTLRGIGGEAEVAKRKLDELLEKHGMDLSDAISDIVKTYRFPYKTVQEECLIVQCYHSLGPESPKVFEYSRRGRKLKEVGLDMTPAQHVDLLGMLTYYKTALKKETDRLFMAFVQRHKLYSPPDGKEKESSMTAEELEQLVAMMRSLGEKSYFKPAGFIA